MSSRPARAVGGWPARSELFAVLLPIAVLNGLAPRISAALSEGYAMAFASLLGLNAVIWFALYALFRIALDDPAPQPLRPADKWIAAALVAGALFPVMIAASIALFGAAIYLLRTSAPDAPLRKLALIALAATGPLLWGPICLALLGPEIARFEALIIAGGTGLETQGNLFRSFDGSATFIITGGCSALANISIAMLLLVVLAQLLDIPLTRRLVPVAAAAVGATILANTARLAALGFWPDHYLYLHDGAGRNLVAWAGLILTGTVIGIGLYRVARKPA
jgi:exosortase/archaeosortase family protein